MTHDALCPVDKSQSEAIALNGKWIDPSGVVCICERLERVREDERSLHADDLREYGARGERNGYDAGLSAAREAVAGIPCAAGRLFVERALALAAIDALVKP